MSSACSACPARGLTPPNAYNFAMAIAPIPELVAELAAGRMVILVDEEDRENEGDLVLAADHVTPEAINFMAKFGRGLICLTLTRERCERLQLPPMAAKNGAQHGTAFTVSIEAASGVTTGISAADRARTVQAAVKKDARASDLVQPGHIFPLQAHDGGVLMRAGHTEAGCDLAAMAGLAPAAVICEVMNDDGTMARLPDLIAFAEQHGLKIGTIASLIEHRSRNESLIERAGTRKMLTPQGEFDCTVYTDKTGGLHLALTRGRWTGADEVLVRVHEPLSVLDLLDAGPSDTPGHCRGHWPRCRRASAARRYCSTAARTPRPCCRRCWRVPAARARTPQPLDLRTYGVGAQILRDLGVAKMKLLGSPRRMPSMAGYGLEVNGFVEDEPPVVAAATTAATHAQR
jgi:3,4-dihydroxy 2-butanone 4-phosphate synthase/GTP cyclohydrolase II